VTIPLTEPAVVYTEIPPSTICKRWISRTFLAKKSAGIGWAFFRRFQDRTLFIIPRRLSSALPRSPREHKSYRIFIGKQQPLPFFLIGNPLDPPVSYIGQALDLPPVLPSGTPTEAFPMQSANGPDVQLLPGWVLPPAAGSFIGNARPGYGRSYALPGHELIYQLLADNSRHEVYTIRRIWVACLIYQPLCVDSIKARSFWLIPSDGAS
jgi:hypothetical protein